MLASPPMLYAPYPSAEYEREYEYEFQFHPSPQTTYHSPVPLTIDTVTDHYYSQPQPHHHFRHETIALSSPLTPVSAASTMSHSSNPPPSQMPPPSSANGLPIDPTLALYPPYYGGSYQHHQQHPQHSQNPPSSSMQSVSIPSYPSPSSQDSVSAISAANSPSQEVFSVGGSSRANSNGKRPSASSPEGGRKKARKESVVSNDYNEGSPSSPAADGDSKPKSTRGSRACTTCRRLKMKCVGAEAGPPCKRCSAGNHECIFEESNRGKRSSKKHELLTRSIRKMERTLDTVLRSIGNPSIASGMISRSPSPDITQQAPERSADPTSQLLGSRDSSPPESAAQSGRPASPKLHSLPDNSLNPLGLLAEASLSNRRISRDPYNPAGLVARNAEPLPGEPSGSGGRLGVASANYFKPGPMTILPLRRLYIERQVQPEMLSFTSKEDVVKLFDIYFEHMNPHCSLLQRDFHTPALVCSRSPFLLTSICAIASKFLTLTVPPPPDVDKAIELHNRLIELAKKLAYSVPAAGYKSVEIVQAYLLLAQWGCGAVERYEQDRTWGLLGMGIRMATDLNLHRKSASSLSRPTNATSSSGAPANPATTRRPSSTTPTDGQGKEDRARETEIHNRERTWIVCFCLDRSFSAQMGKPYSIREDEIIRDVHHWGLSPVGVHADLTLAAYVDLQRIVSRFLDFLYSATGTDSPTASGLLGQCDHLMVIRAFETQLMAWHESWQLSNLTMPRTEYYKPIAQFYFHYALLVLNSFGLQDSLRNTPINMPHFFSRVYHSAMKCALVVKDELGPNGFLRYSSDSFFVQISYAILSLLKLIRPEFQSFLESEQQILSVVKECADLLEAVAVNPHHTPALYSVFIKALIAAKEEDESDAARNMQQPASSSYNSSATVNGHHDPMLTSFGATSPGSAHDDTQTFLDQFQFLGEMGPGAHDMSTFPPVMAAQPSMEDAFGAGGLGGANPNDSMNILSSGFWDSMLVPGYNTMDGISGGFVFGAGGSGLITPRVGGTPNHSGQNTPSKGGRGTGGGEITQVNLNNAFDAGLDGTNGSKM